MLNELFKIQLNGEISNNFYYKSLLEVFLLSEHILCKERIVLVKKFDFEILTYLYVFRSTEFICAIFTVMYVCMCVCLCVCVCVCVRERMCVCE